MSFRYLDNELQRLGSLGECELKINKENEYSIQRKSLKGGDNSKIQNNFFFWEY